MSGARGFLQIWGVLVDGEGECGEQTGLWGGTLPTVLWSRNYSGRTTPPTVPPRQSGPAPGGPDAIAQPLAVLSPPPLRP